MITKTISISNGNSKMGEIPSVSLPPIVTCKHSETCGKTGQCYVLKLLRFRTKMRDAYNRNYEILMENRDSYFAQIKAAAITSRFFRFHVSGDIVDIDYLDRMVKLARELKETRFLVFTKNYEDVNEYFKSHKKPKNLQIVMSLPFNGEGIDNPHNFPTAAIILKGDTPKDTWKICGGNCSECACRGVGCWELKKGETIAFHEH